MDSKQIGIEEVKSSIRDVIDFPKEGIVFKDITTAIKDPAVFKYCVDQLYNYYKDKGITKVIGIESRGFILGSALAYRLNAGFVPIRKPGKLPADTIQQSYDLEYGTDTIEIHEDALSNDDTVLIHDDLLATGGTVCAATSLVEKIGVTKTYINFMVELDFLKGRERLDEKYEVYSLLRF
ncbi:adenine phosphoribosyltransferase [Halosquirtibacter xylanolyticus]|uniref:adenine phosphoribosyltransferase n=1 Tax=Halosquirtibacter xylanolyticus TaxID=3374599 RepID=UPI00374A687D|nr:adenine phosphoribosyltransferase [Prolixibacteraceae bacterium]